MTAVRAEDHDDQLARRAEIIINSAMTTTSIYNLNVSDTGGPSSKQRWEQGHTGT